MSRRSFPPRKVRTKDGKRLILRAYRWKDDYPQVEANLKSAGLYDRLIHSRQFFEFMGYLRVLVSQKAARVFYRAAIALGLDFVYPMSRS